MKPQLRNRPVGMALLAIIVGACTSSSSGGSPSGSPAGDISGSEADAQPGLDAPAQVGDDAVAPNDDTQTPTGEPTPLHDTSFTLLQAAGRHMPVLAQALSAAIARQNDLAGAVGQPGEQLRQRLGYLLREHVYLTAAVTGAVLRGDLQALFDARHALDDDTLDLTAAWTELYGDTAGGQFGKIWSEHIGFFVDYALATAGDDQVGKQRAMQDLDGYSQQFGQLVSVLTGGVLVDSDVQPSVAVQVADIEAVVDAQANQDYGNAAVATEAGAAHMDLAALTLSVAFARQKGLKGDPASVSGELLARLTGLLTAHTFQVGALTDAVIDGRQLEVDAWNGQLARNTRDLTTAFLSLYGEATARRFDAMWRGQIDAFVRDSLGVANGDAGTKAQAQADLARYAGQFGLFAGEVTGGLFPREEASQSAALHVQTLLAVIDAQGRARPVAATSQGSR
jgi:hypothetical protein